MSRRENNNKKKKILIQRLMIIIGIALIAILVVGLMGKFQKTENTVTQLIINNKNVTERVKKDIIIENGTIYLAKEDVMNFFDKYLYQDEKTGNIITTYEKKMASLKINSKKITVNGSEKQINATAKEQNDTFYLPMTEMDDIYNIDINYITDTNIITMDSLDREQQKAYASKNISIKSTPKIISKKIGNVKKGNWVIYISDADRDEDWAKVRTESGIIGYVKKSKLTNFVTEREAMEEETHLKGKVNLVWDYYSQYAEVPERTGKIEGINVVSPSCFYITNKGEFKENIGKKGEAYIEWAHKNGYKVWPIVSNAEAGIDVTSKIINSYDARQKLISNIIDACVKYKLDGVNIDFENMYQEDKGMFSRLIIELTPQLKEISMIISVDVTAPDGAETWSMCFDRHVIGDVADYIIFMAYDQYGASSTKAGTTAGYNWVETNLKKFIETEEIESEKIILAVPLYTRVWTEKGDTATSKTVDMKDINKVIPSSAKKEWNETLKQNYVEYKEGNATKKIWIEDLDSIKAKLVLVKQYKLGGVAAWEKDREDEGVWSIIKDALK